jgi:hypothetical protein
VSYLSLTNVGWVECYDTTPQELIEWIERAGDKKRSGIRTVVRAYKP